MKANDKDNVREMVRYVVDHGTDIDRIKLMKLLFIAENVDKTTGEIKPERNHFINSDFLVYNYGVFNFDVYRELRGMLIGGELTEDKFLKLSSEPTKKRKTLVPAIKEQIDYVLQNYDCKNGWELADTTLKMIGIDPEQKKNYFGMPIEVVKRKVSGELIPDE